MRKKQEPTSNRRWLVISKSNGKPLLGWDHGITSEDKARRLNDSYLIDTEIQLYHEYHNLPDPDAEEEE